MEFSSFKLFGGLGLCFLVCFPFFRGLAWIPGLGFSPAFGREGFSSSSFLLLGLRVPFLSFLVLSFPFFSLLLFVLLALLTLGGSGFSFFPLYLLVFWLGCFCFFFFFSLGFGFLLVFGGYFVVLLLLFGGPCVFLGFVFWFFCFFLCFGTGGFVCLFLICGVLLGVGFFVGFKNFVIIVCFPFFFYFLT